MHTPPKWLTEARKYHGLREVPGKGDNPTIVNWLRTLSAWWADDLQPWCGTFLAHCFSHVGIPVPKYWYRALAWAEGLVTAQLALKSVPT